MPENVHNTAQVHNPAGRASVLLVCDHASNFIPAGLTGLGLSAEQLCDHVAWDIGAWDLSCRLADLLDAPLVGAAASRLLIDPNRNLEAPDLIPLRAEGTIIPGNQALGETERIARISDYHRPFHEAIEAILAAGQAFAAIVSVHSFTPVLYGKSRPWNAGILHGDDARLADLMLDTLGREPHLNIGRNEPYAPSDGVYYTLDRHGAGLANVMIEVRNDQLREEGGCQQWAQRLADALRAALARL